MGHKKPPGSPEGFRFVRNRLRLRRNQFVRSGEEGAATGAAYPENNNIVLGFDFLKFEVSPGRSLVGVFVFKF